MVSRKLTGAGLVLIAAGLLLHIVTWLTADADPRDAVPPPLHQTDSGWPSTTTTQPPLPTDQPARAFVGDPYQGIHTVYRAIANGLSNGCDLFSADAAEQFARNWGAVDCPAAMRNLVDQVDNPTRYAAYAMGRQDLWLEDTAGISSCQPVPEGGPPLGRFIFTRTSSREWYISGHEPESC